MSFEEFQFIILTILTGFVTGFLTTYFGIKISKLLILVGIILVLAQYFIINNMFDLSWINIEEIFEINVNEYGDEITNIKEVLIKNIPLTIGVIVGVLYGIKKGL